MRQRCKLNWASKRNRLKKDSAKLEKIDALWKEMREKEGPKLRALQPWLSEEEAERLVVGKIWIGMDYLELTLARGDPDDMHTLVFQDNNHVQHVNSTVYYTGRDAVVARVASVLSKNNGIRGRFGRDLVLPVTTIKLRRTLPKR
jgi:hypothetical protein